MNVAGWRVGYAHFLPATYLARFDVAERAARWRERLVALSPDEAPTWVAVDAADGVIGFSHTGPVRDPDLERALVGELYGLYVDPAHWRSGIGAALMRPVDEFWAPTAVGAMVLWVFEANARARAFYERFGFRADGTSKVRDFDGVAAVEVRYRRDR